MLFEDDPLGLYSTDVKYEGSTRATQYCIDDFMKHLYGIHKIKEMTILTHGQYHALMLSFENDDFIVFIKSGLTSGYPGEGPKGTSLIIRLAEEANIPIKELNVTVPLLKRINSSRAMQKDIEFIKSNGKESINYDRLCLEIVNKEYVQRAKDSFKKNKDIVFVRAENEKTKDSAEISRTKAIKMLQEIHEAVTKSKNTKILSDFGNASSILSLIKSFL